MMENIISLQRLGLSQDAQGRELAAAIYDFWLCPSSAKVVKSGKEAAADYLKAVKDKGKGHGLGSPHLQ
eukprot:2960016-Pyramimonas_sp.AAC.1